ncbi:MAG TPA: glycine--tRNA ligase subunit beta, partial [Gammaproteobacteria bacterium]|nr:glycine--tRNA ligase subunit beta [Gammaproteobacteria bacterium]
MTKHADCLIEIHTEELPPKVQIKLSHALAEMVTEKLRKENLSFELIRPFATPRRLALLITGLASAQPDQVIERKGPGLNAAYDATGKPTKALEGFARSCGVSISDLKQIKNDQGGWVVCRQEVKGKSITDLLPDLINQSVQALPIAKRMRWGSDVVEFVRPVHSVILLYGKKIIPAEILGCKTSNVTSGHRFMADKKLKITAPAEYESILEKQGKVIVDFNKRRDIVHEEAHACVGKKGKVVISDELLDEVTGLVEFPVALCGQFDKEFLTVPKEVLISSMQDHQRYFPVTNSKDELLPYFIAISNIKSKNGEQVIHGNERVLRARLSDAKFFFDTDQHERLFDR